MMKNLRALRHCNRGAAAVEFAVVALVMILLALAIIEFGRGWQIRNELAFAADFGTRRILTDEHVSTTELENELREALTISDPNLLEVTIGTEAVDGIQFRTVSVTYPFTLLLPTRAGDVIRISVLRRTPVT